MKKVVFILSVAAIMASCSNGPSKKELSMAVDSLKVEIAERDNELNEVMDLFNSVSEGFSQINEAENRVTINSNSLESGAKNAKQQIINDIEFIQNKMKENKEQIAHLEEKLKNSKNNSAKLQKLVVNLKSELETKGKELAALNEELSNKNIRIKELDETVASLNASNEELTAKNNANEKRVNAQDIELNTAWYAIGSKKELKENNILTNTGLFKKGDVMEDANVNREFFTQIDIRNTKEIALGTEDAKILTTHPEGSYSIEKGEDKKLTLRINDAKSFWSVTRYLVVKS